ncbi:transcriptional regulator FeaR [Pseudomonas sihuiensis]|uniref:AraC family transcriptional regulator, positive regulator of tynA and feaB n=1 Tax=Pseudomonas sihuiensis TaxID=1274359 RepID=A0A1H2MW55_9PSED|nr:transcriptional regulator FeaR [Pseudomonas sihuiensis]SDU97304.1 AraC family transcriptional regulator, positive regulator of tynA and feaB [Pseudomonas sihuiensis]
MTILRAEIAGRFDGWLHDVNQVCGHFDAQCLGEGFSGSIREHQTGALRLSFVDITQARLFRSSKEIAQSDCKHFYLVSQLAGRAGMEQAGNCVEMQPGDITLIDSSVPNNFLYEDSSRQISLILPRHLLEQSRRFTEVHCAQRIPASAPMAAMANRLILESTQQGALSVSESEATLEALVSLLRPVLCASDSVPDAHERLFRKTLRFIDEHICSEELCPEAIAREVGVSMRGLYRMFAKKGLVVAQYIKNRRLDFCAETLRQAGSEQKLSALGYEWGFTDSSYFSTAFKARFGVSPSDYRKRYSGR